MAMNSAWPSQKLAVVPTVPIVTITTPLDGSTFGAGASLVAVAAQVDDWPPSGIASVTGTEGDPQAYSRQVASLREGRGADGIARLREQLGAPSGLLQVRLRHGERLNPDGTLYASNLRSASSTDVFLLKGGGEETLEPVFTFHGFQYVEVTGLREKPETSAVTGIPWPWANRIKSTDPAVLTC